MADVNRIALKNWALAIVQVVEPDDAFVVEENFDALVDNWDRAKSQDEGRFIGGPEVAAFAGVIGPFLLGFFGDVGKDLVKDQVKQFVGGLLDKLLGRTASVEEASRLRRELEDAVQKSRFRAAQKQVLSNGFNKLFAQIGKA
jgi:hypothetical protein